jgi:4-amino-4-deoxy-L-arabinose transferase-like glycosyltransferase
MTKSMQPPVATHGKALATILAVGAALRVALFLWTWMQSPDLIALHSPDTAAYVKPAEALLAQGRFSIDNLPEVFHTPGYPLLLLPGVALHQVELVTFSIQLLLSLATIWLVWRMALDLCGDRVAAIGAGLLMAVEPLAIIYTSALLSETLFTFLFVLCLRYLLRYAASNSSVDLAICGLLLAAATYVRPVSYYLPAVLIAGLLVRAVWLKRPRVRLMHCGIFAVASFVPLAAWQMRNDRVAGYSAFSASGEFNLYFHQAAWAVAQRTGQTLESVQGEFGGTDGKLLHKVHPELHGASRAQRYAFMGREGKRLIRQNLRYWFQAEIRNALRIALNPGGTSFLQLAVGVPVSRPLRPAGVGVLATVRQMAEETPALFYTSLVLGITVGVTYLLSIVGWLVSFKHRPWEMLALLGIAGYLTAVSAGVVEARMRHPVMPILCLLGGAGILAIKRLFVSRPVRPAETAPALSVYQGRIGHLAGDLGTEPLGPVATFPVEANAGAQRVAAQRFGSLTTERGEATPNAG